MKVKNLIPFFVLILFLSVLASDIADGPPLFSVLILLFALSAILYTSVFFNKKFLRFLVPTLALLLCCFILMHSKASSQPFTTLEKDSITGISGKLIYDSSEYENGRSILTLKLLSCANVYNNEATANGMVSAVWESSDVLCCGCRVSLSGHFAGDLFVVKSLRVTDKKPVHFLRQSLIKFIRQRILDSECSKASCLSLQLILGTSEDTSEIKDLARSCGCLHVLALSGMHLNVVTSICNCFGKKHVFPKILKYCLATLFVFIAGPRPSLVRALIMIYLSFLPSDERLVLTFIIQSIVFPGHMVNVGCIFAYASTFALFCLSPYLKYSLSVLIGKHAAQPIGNSLAVIVFTAPIQLCTSSEWYISALLAGPPAGFLASASMVLGLCKLIFPTFKLLNLLNNLVYQSMYGLFCCFSKLPGMNLTCYAFYLVLVLFLVSFPLIRKPNQPN